MEEQVIPSLGRIFKKAELCCKATLLVLFVFLVSICFARCKLYRGNTVSALIIEPGAMT